MTVRAQCWSWILFPVLLAGCGEAAAIDAELLPGRSSAGESLVEPGRWDASDVVTLLDWKMYAFRFKGGPLTARLLIEEDGEKQLSKEFPFLGTEGSLVLCIRRQEDVLLWSSADAGGESLNRVQHGGLWWEYGSRTHGETTLVKKPIVPKAGEEVDLVRHAAEEREGTRSSSVALIVRFDSNEQGPLASSLNVDRLPIITNTSLSASVWSGPWESWEVRRFPMRSEAAMRTG